MIAFKRTTYLIPSLFTVLLALSLGAALILAANTGRRSAPRPAGMIFRVSLREGGGVFDRFSAEFVPGPPRMLAVRADPFRHYYSFPDGALVRTESVSVPKLRTVRTKMRFDFDGDATEDLIQIQPGGVRGLIRVVSGSSGALLFEDRDDLQYEDGNRAFSLGDIDDDGLSELALVYPRIDRSSYDLDILDWCFGVQSWITVVKYVR